MNLQFVVDGLLTGSMIGLGAIGVTLTYSILRFSNFAHGDFMAWGTYATLAVVSALGAMFGKIAPIGALSFGWPLIVAVVIGCALTGLMALMLDVALFSRLRLRGQSIIVVMASFGASMALRSLLEFIFTSRPTYFSRAIQIAMPVGFGIRITPDQIALLILTALLVAGTHLLITRTQTGRSMQAVSQNPALARVVGIDVARVVRATWLLGGALACIAGVMVGILVQIRPLMGFDAVRRQELDFATQFHLHRRWRHVFHGTYDIDREEFDKFEVGALRRQHSYEIGMYWDFVRESAGLEFGLVID